MDAGTVSETLEIHSISTRLVAHDFTANKLLCVTTEGCITQENGKDKNPFFLATLVLTDYCSKETSLYVCNTVIISTWPAMYTEAGLEIININVRFPFSITKFVAVIAFLQHL
jgi:hypothetical protein